MKDDSQHDHPKVQELRDLSRWSDGQFWVSPEQHGNLVSSIKTDIHLFANDESRPLSSRTRSTGSHSALAQYALHKVVHSASLWSLEDLSLSILLILYEYSDDGCACL